MGNTIISLKRLRKVFSLGNQPLVALEDICLSIEEQTFFSLVGPSGCGKTTLLNIVGGLLDRTSGQVLIAGKEIKGPSREVGMMFQSPVLLPWRTNLKNVLLPIEVFDLERKTYQRKALELLKLVGLKGFEYRYPFELSGGMQQRLAICRMLIYDPILLLMDEPFGALDEMSREFMNFELLRIWQEAKKTVLFVTHNIAEAVFLSDTIVVMTARPGKVAGILRIDLPRPRHKGILSSPEFLAYTKAVREILG